MKSKKFIVAIIAGLAFSMVFILGGCGGSAPSKEVPQPKKIKISMATAGTGGTLYPVGGAMADIINKTFPGEIVVTAEATGGSVEDIRLLEGKQADIATVGMDTAWRAVSGDGENFKNKKSSVVGLFNMYNQPVHFVVLKNSPIKSMSDIKGKRVSVGAPGSGNEDKCKIMLESLGITYKDFKPEFISFAESVDALRDGNLDAAFVWAGVPNSSIMDLASTKPISVLEISDQEAEKIIQKMPYIYKTSIPKGTYKGVEGEVKTLAITTGMIARPDLSEDVAYKVVKAVFDNLDSLSQAHAAIKDCDLKMGPAMCIPLHPGAQRFFKEKGALK